MSPHISRSLAPIAGISIAIFAVLALVHGLVGRTNTNPSYIINSYESLVVELGQSNVLPMIDAEQMQAALATIIPTDAKQDNAPSITTTDQQVRLGNAIFAKISVDGIYEIEMSPQYWMELKPGNLRETLKKISEFELSEQLTAANVTTPGSSQFSFSFTVDLSSQPYRITPIFQDKRCIALILRRG